MITVKLYGHLGKRFGRVHRFNIKTPAEAIRALRANFSGFAHYLTEHSAPGYKVVADAGCRSADQLHDPIGGGVLKIVPTVAGASRGWGQTILGAVLIVAGFVLSFSGAPAIGAFVADIGFLLMVGGVSQMLFSPPTPSPDEGSKANAPSYVFNGAVNTTKQGNPVPVCYGRLQVGSQVISGGMYAAAI